MERHTETQAERAEREEIERSLKTSTYLTDHFWESIHSGIKPTTPHVPNYQNPTQMEGESLHMDMNGFYKNAAGNMSAEDLHSAMQNAHTPREGDEPTFPGEPQGGYPLPQSNQPRHVLSQNQAVAVKKYPMLVEFLGRPEGDKIAKEISGHMNAVIADVVHANSKEANDSAVICKADKQNLREYFQGDGWVCRVTASGPFRGDEAIYYSSDKDVARILRKSVHGGEIRYADISEQFNIIYEMEEGKFPSEIVEESVEQTTSKGEKNESNEESKETVAEVLEESTEPSIA